VTCQPTRLELAALESRDDGIVYAEMACARCGERFEMPFTPSETSGSAFSQHRASVAITSTLALLNRRLRRSASP